MKEQELLQNLQKMIAAYDRILFLPDNAQEIAVLLDACPKEQIQKKTLLLSGGMLCNPFAGADWIRLDEEDYVALKRLYLTYEFSDKFRMLSVDGNFGTIVNYLRTGLLSAEETAAALLGWKGK